MSPKIVLDQKKIWSRKSFGFENLGPKKFSFKDNLGQKIFWVPKNFDTFHIPDTIYISNNKLLFDFQCCAERGG